VHDPLQKGLLLVPRFGTWNALFTHLLHVTERTQDAQELVNLAVRLSKTGPLQMSGWVQNKLKSSTVAAGWVGAQKLFGSLWHSLLKVSFKSTSMKPTAPPALKAGKKFKIVVIPTVNQGFSAYCFQVIGQGASFCTARNCVTAHHHAARKPLCQARSTLPRALLLLL
jgi:hypothetical protein